MKNNVVKPLARRVGSFVAGIIAAVVALSPEQIATVEAALTMLILVAVDLCASYWEKK